MAYLQGRGASLLSGILPTMNAGAATGVSPITSKPPASPYLGTGAIECLACPRRLRGHIGEGDTMVTGKSSGSRSGRLTASEWAAITSSLVFIVLWLGISFA
jgi:hypothetical protein